jgi:hypothetical protein
MSPPRLFPIALLGPALTLLAACSQAPPRSAARTAQPQPAAVAAQGSEAVWHLRAGLNVAALSCRGRGRVAVAGDYRQLLSRHDRVLAASYQSEIRRYGQSGLDRHQTQIYNRFANQRSPERFCRTAQGVARQAVAMNAVQLQTGAGRMVSELERAR